MKFGTIILSFIFVVMSINSAVAGGNHRRHHNYKHHNHGHGHKHYKYRYPRYNSYRSHGHHGHYSDHGDNFAYALGGLVLGGIIGATISNSNNSRSQYSNYTEQVYTPSYPANRRRSSNYMASEGNCYAISHVNNGNLVLSPVSSGNCK